jgi:hypothetical protein
MNYLTGSASALWDTNSTYDQPVYQETVTRDIATQSQAVSTVASNDGWTDLFKSTISSVFDYAIKKDAMLTSAEVQKQLTPQTAPVPVFVQQASAAVQGISSTTMLLIAAAVGVYLFTQKS